MSAEVREILERIRRLPEPDRLELRSELSREEEQEWVQMLTQAREMARQRGIDDAAIVRAVESLRYGDKSNG
jgi:hypothetical protein